MIVVFTVEKEDLETKVTGSYDLFSMKGPKSPLSKELYLFNHQCL